MRPDDEAPGRRTFLAGSALVFAACAAATIAAGRDMGPMGAAWTIMCGQTWWEAASGFLAMWAVMMAAMMAPSLAPQLWLRRRALAPVLAGYGLIWILAGATIFAAGAGLADLLILRPDLARAAPLAGGLVVMGAGAAQFTRWKARHLAACRQAPRDERSRGWGEGLRLGLHCCCSCAGPMAILLAVGVMDLGAMALATAAITAERLAPAGRPVAQVLGLAALALGAVMTWQAAGQA